MLKKQLHINSAFVKLLLCVFITLCFHHTFAQSKDDYLIEEITTKEFKEADWKKVIEGIDFTEVKKEAEKKKKEAKELDTSGLWSGLFKFLLIGAGILVVVLLLVHFFGGGNLFRPKSKKVESVKLAVDIENVEEDLHQADMDDFINQALEKGDYNLAIRLYYLAIIKELSLGKQIKWKRDKTNRDYLLEMRSSDAFTAFKDCTQSFERVWYGNSQLDKMNYNHIVIKFKSLLNTARSQAVLVEA